MKNELKKLSRAELLEIIYEMKKNEETLTQQLEEAKEKLAQREIRIEEAGSIAEASLSLSGVFEAAQNAADTYLKSVKAGYAGMEQKMAEAEEAREQMLKEAQIQADKIVKNAELQNNRIVEETEAAIREKENRFQETVARVLASNAELKELIR